MLRNTFIFFLLILMWNADARAQDYLWPSASGPYLSSTFGETRSRHFHAGLDIKTWGREGYQVFASKKGTLYRILVTERGYGNALYLKHDDGSYTVYAHLQRFNDQFQQLTDSLRMKDYSFEVDATVEAMGIEVLQGDVIGYTGSTGIGPPHLHFEVRDSLQQPQNALQTGLDIRDTRPPVFSSLLIEPLEARSRIQTRPVSKTARPSISNDGSYDFGEFSISGHVGVAVNVFDQANRVPNAYAVYSLALVHEGDTLFYEELDEFSYEEDEFMFLDRAAPFGSTRRAYQRLYKKDGPDIPFYKIVDPRSKIHPIAQPGKYSIVASDYFGNRSVAHFTVQPDTSIYTTTSLSGYEFPLPLNEWYWAEDWVSSDLEQSTLLDRDLGGFFWTPTQQIVSLDSTLKVNFVRYTPGISQKVQFPDGKLKVRFGEEAFYDSLTVAAYHNQMDGLPFISVQPAMLPAASSFGIEYYMGTDDFDPNLNYRLFKIDPDDGELSYVDSELIGRTLHAFPDELGDFVIRDDSKGPIINDIRIHQTDYGRWQVTARVEDVLTGIDSSTGRFFVNGVRGIAEYDYEEELLIYYLPGFVPDENNNTVKIELKDRAGNITSLQEEGITPVQ